MTAVTSMQTHPTTILLGINIPTKSIDSNDLQGTVPSPPCDLGNQAKREKGAAGDLGIRVDAMHEGACPQPLLSWNCDVSRSHSTSYDRNSLARSRASVEAFTNPRTAGILDPRNEQELRTLLAESAHEIRSPIAVATQLIWAAQRQLESLTNDTSDIRKLLRVAEGRCHQASQWAENILTWRRLSSGQPIAVRKKFLPVDWKASMAPVLDGLASSRKINLQWIGWDRDLPRMYTDPDLLTRILTNLVGNAVDASSIGQTVSIRVAAQSNIVQQLVVTVEDTGRGMRPELVEFLNGPQMNLSKVTTKVTNGIGLQNVKQLCAATSASIMAQISASGGTIIRVAIPVDDRASLIRTWLLQQARQNPSNQSPRSFRMLAVKYSGENKENTVALDECLQKQSSPRDFIYSVARDRWVWMTIDDDKAVTRITECLDRARELADVGTLDRQSWLVHPFMSWAWNSDEILAVAAQPGKTAGTSNAVVSNLNQIVQKTSKALDELVGSCDTSSGEAAQAIAVRSPATKQTVANWRLDQSQPVLNTPKNLRQASLTSGTKPTRVDQLPRMDIQRELGAPMAVNAPRIDARHALSEISAQWNQQQDLLARRSRRST